MYKSKLHQGKKRNFEILDVIEFLHRVCLHIPCYYEALILYYGHYANAAWGKKKKLGLESQLPLNIIDDAPDRKTCRRNFVDRMDRLQREFAADKLREIELFKVNEESEP